jgi:hypothetical protein
MSRGNSLLRVAGMATMPSRATTAPRAIESILQQVSRLWLFLDRFETVPDYAKHEGIEVLRSQDLGDLRANGKFLGLALDSRPCTFFGVDDDVLYPADYCRTLESHLGRWSGATAVGVHGGLLPAPVNSYARNLKVLHRRAPRQHPTEVDLLGSDSVAFRTSTLRFDVREWPDVNMVDLSLALSARRRSVPLVTVPRKAYWLSALDENQSDSIWAGVLRDDSRQTALAQELVALPRPPLPRRRSRWPRLFVRAP